MCTAAVMTVAQAEAAVLAAIQAAILAVVAAHTVVQVAAPLHPWQWPAAAAIAAGCRP